MLNVFQIETIEKIANISISVVEKTSIVLQSGREILVRQEIEVVEERIIVAAVKYG